MSQFSRSSNPEHTGIRQWDTRPERVEDYTRLDVIGQPGKCWCGDEDGHDWPGRADGTPHPR